MANPISLTHISFLPLILPALPTALAKPPITASTLAPLIQQLGDPSYQTREQATKTLISLGTPIAPALAAAQKSATDFEIQSRQAGDLTFHRTHI